MSTTATATKPQVPTKVITGVVRLSYPALFEPKSMDPSDEKSTKKYSASLLISKDDTETIAKIEAAIEAAKKDALEKNKGKLPKNFKLPLRDGDEERDDDEAYQNHFFINATSKTKPGVVDLMRDEITDETKVYAGCYVRASINFYYFDVNGNKGIAAGLNNIQKVRDGERLAGRASAEDDFNDEFVPDEDPLA